jgi:hypothetical protein
MEIILTLFFIGPASAADFEQSCEALINFYDLWHDSAFGWNPNGAERAAWILSDHDTYRFQKWQCSGERNKEKWKGPVPDGLAGMVHTHPNRRDPRPSPADILMAKKLHIPVFIISKNGLWMSAPDGKISRVMKYVDFKESVQTCSK